MMMNIIGKIIFLLFTFNLAACEFSFKILNYAGDQVKQVLVGVPFQLQIIAKGDCEFDKLEFDKNFENYNLNSLGVTKTINNINGLVSRVNIHKYSARIDNPGLNKFGQIKFWNNSNLIGDLEFSVDVVEQNDLPNDFKKYPNVELKASNHQLYLGENFILNVKLYFTNHQINPPRLTIPAGLDQLIDLEFISQPVSGSEQYNGANLNYWQWQILGSFKQSGQFVMPAFSVSYERIDRSNNFFIFTNHEQITLFSNVIKFDVLNLPPSNQAVQGIGHFTSFKATVDQSTLTANQAVQLNLDLEGDGNWSKIIITDLSGLPSNLHAYAGQALQQDHHKKFEFILQGVQIGACKIPVQSFYYFDTKYKSYRTIYTQPIELNVLSIHQNSSIQVTTNQIELEKQQIHPILESGEIKYRKNYYLPIHVWLILSGILILGFLFKFSLNKIYLFLLSSLFAINLSANLEENFLRANQLYQAGQFSKALDLYQNIDFNDGRGAVVWYNLGNCYFERKEFVNAIQAWLQAGKIGNWQIACRCRENILVAQSNLKIAEELNYVPNFWVSAIILYDNFFIFQLLSLMFLGMLFACLIKWPNYAKLIWIFVVLIESVMISVAILCIKENNLSYAVVQNNTTLFAGPSHQYHGLIDLKSGLIINIIKQSSDWCQVQNCHTGQNGWVLKQDLRII